MVAGSSGPNWMTDSLWESERQSVLSYYPEAYPAPGRFMSWALVMDPIPSREELDAVLMLLSADATVSVGKRGAIRAAETKAASCSSDQSRLGVYVPRRPYWVTFEYPPEAQGVVGPIHPRVRVVAPEISLRTYTGHPHLSFADDRDSWACPLSPHESSWCWEEGATWWYLAQVALWILKTEVWARTGGGIGNMGVWLGSATPHRPSHVLALRGRCRCGSGSNYMSCHYRRDYGALLNN
jgi:hypothetical protein